MKGIFACTAFALVVVLASGEHGGGGVPDEKFPEFQIPEFECPDCPIINTGCECSVDLLVIFDRSGSIDQTSFNNVRSMVNNFIQTLDYECSRTSVISFARNANDEYDFDDPAATDPAIANNEINGISNPSGSTNTGDALCHAALQFLNNPNPPGVCKVVALFTDGQSNRGPDVILKAADLNDKTDARLCIMGMADPGESASTIQRRYDELFGIHSVSHPTSGVVFNTNYQDANNIPMALEQLRECVCRPCYSQKPTEIEP